MQTDRLAPPRVLPTPGTPRRRHRVVWTPAIGSGLLRAKRSPERGEARKCGNSPSAFNEYVKTHPARLSSTVLQGGSYWLFGSWDRRWCEMTVSPFFVPQRCPTASV